MIFAFGLSVAVTVVCFLVRSQLVGVFLSQPEAYDYAVRFTGILLTTSFLFGCFYVLVNALQAMGAAKESLVVSLSRQGLFYIPAIFLLRALLGVTGLVWAQPVADVLSTTLVILLYIRSIKRLKGKQDTKNNQLASASQTVISTMYPPKTV